MKVIVTQNELNTLAAQYVESQLGRPVSFTQFICDDEEDDHNCFSCEVTLRYEDKADDDLKLLGQSLVGRRIRVLRDISGYPTKGVLGEVVSVDLDGDVWANLEGMQLTPDRPEFCIGQNGGSRDTFELI